VLVLTSECPGKRRAEGGALDPNVRGQASAAAAQNVEDSDDDSDADDTELSEALRLSRQAMTNSQLTDETPGASSSGPSSGE
jgi:hypothetical protein